VGSDTEEVTGSNPVAPTNNTVTSGNAGQFAVRGRFQEAVYRMKSVRCSGPFQEAVYRMESVSLV
jgi:hypothetical protein